MLNKDSTQPHVPYKFKELSEIHGKLDSIEKTFNEIAYLRNLLIEVSSRCNLNCIQCAHSDMKRPKKDMEFSLYKKVVYDAALNFPTAKIWLSNYGEPLIVGHKIYDMITYAKQKGLIVYMNTNGVLLNEEMCDLIIKSKLDHIVIGVEGYSAGVYESIRVGAKRDAVYNNVLMLHNKMQERGAEYPQIEVQFIVMDENEHELEDYKKFWAERGIAVNIRGRMTWAGNISIGSNIDKQKERVACGYTFSAFNVLSDGRVVTCANDINATNVLGDMNTETIEEIWQRKKDKFTSLHFSHEFDKLPEYCRNCYDWQAVGTVGYNESGENYKKVYK